MINDIISFFSNISFSRIIGIIFWVCIILGALGGFDSTIFFGFFVFYIMFFPIYRRMDIFILSQNLLLMSNAKLSIISLLFLFILWIILLIKFLGKFSKSPSWLKSFTTKFGKIWIIPIDLIVHVIILRIKVIHNFVKFILRNLTKYLNTKTKKLLFFSFFVFVPRIITLGAIWYDLHIEKAFVWSPILGLLVIIAIITKFFFIVLEHYCTVCLQDMFTYVYWESEEMTKEEEEIIVNKLGRQGNYGLKKLVFKGPMKEGVENISLDFFFDEIVQFYHFKAWFITIKDIFSKISQGILFWFITLEIITQIILICY